MTTGEPPTIFRHSAVERYAQAQEHAAPLQIGVPRRTGYLWACLLALLVGSGAWIGTVRVPIYVSGSAAVARLPPDAAAAPGEVALVALLPAGKLAELRVGQELLLRAGDGELRRQPILAVAPSPMRPAEIRSQLALPEATGASDEPVAVAIARLDPTAGQPPADMLGGVYRVDVVVGTRPALALLPPLAPLFEDDR